MPHSKTLRKLAIRKELQKMMGPLADLRFISQNARLLLWLAIESPRFNEISHSFKDEERAIPPTTPHSPSKVALDVTGMDMIPTNYGPEARQEEIHKVSGMMNFHLQSTV